MGKMNDEQDLQSKTNEDLAAMLIESEARSEALVQSASERFKQSELAGWDECLYQEGMAFLEQVQELSNQTAPIADELESRLGPTLLAEQMRTSPSRPNDNDQRWHRRDLTTLTVPVTGSMDETLPQALGNLLSSVSQYWWRQQEVLAVQQQQEIVLEPLLLCGRERWGLDFTKLHKYAYYLSVTRRYLDREPVHDIYTAARAVPQIYALGTSLEALKAVKGSDRKLRDLWRAPGSETDATIFELLVAAAFARMGHDVSFVETTATKTPDLRLHDKPIPLVVECKRRQALNAYEDKEFSVIREVFAALSTEREELGLAGELSIDFRQEILHLPVAGIVQSIREMTKTLSPYATKETEWGTIQLKPVTVSKDIEATLLYSPQYLDSVFGIDLELDDFDGICAVDSNSRFPEVNRTDLPFLMKWTSNSEAAKERKLQTVLNLLVEAADQIPTGEAGLIYVAYEEGHRPSLADARTDAIRNMVETIYFKRRAISVPMTLISRLFPNIVLDGHPDLIESSIPLVQGDKENYDYWTQEMPTLVFTP